MKKLFSAYYTCEDPFHIFEKTISVLHPDQLTNDGVLILWGGEDISPGIYGQSPVYTHASPKPSRRDIVEIALYKAAVSKGIPIIGICRGAQLACALGGGSLYQHIEDGHHSNHKVETFDQQLFSTSSCHHQALNLKNIPHQLLAWDKGRKIRAYTDKHVEDITIPEVVYFPKDNVLAIQGHPEWMSPNHPFVQWCAKLIKEKLYA